MSPLRFVLAAAVVSATTSAQIVTYTPDPAASSPALAPLDLVRGEAALARLAGAGIDELAAVSGVSVAEVEARVREDEGLYVDDQGRVVFVEPYFVDGDAPKRAGTGNPLAKTPPPIPLSEAFLLHSRPGSDFTIYLDFDGHHSVNNGWGHNIQFPPYNTSGGSGSFSNSELQEIIDVWRHIAEDFAIFDVDVTTEEPPLDRLKKSGVGDTQWGVRDVHTQHTGGFALSAGGIALLNCFSWSLDTPVFSFNKGVNNGSMTGSHEVGHSLGLSHDGLNGSTYHPGVSASGWTWGPIMGAPFGAELVQWSNGDYSGATTTENDTKIITSASNGLTIVPDDYSNGTPNATQIPAGPCPTPNVVELCGTISYRGDKDSFKFTSTGGQVSITASRPEPLGNVDCYVAIYDSNDALVVGANPSGTATASIVANIGPGKHTIIIDGVGQQNLYSDYGSRGTYTIDLVLPIAESSFADLGNALAGVNGDPVLAGDGWACDGETVTVAMTNAASSAPAFLVYGPTAAYTPLLGGVLVPSTGAGGGALGTATNVAGEASQSGAWPAGLSSGATIHFQYWVQDAAGPQGWAASNAVVITVP